MTEHTILVAFTLDAPDRRLAEAHLHSILPSPQGNPDALTSWWVAEDDRRDRSDNDSAVFVTPGQQRRASILLNQEGLTEACNVVPRIEERVADLDTESSASRQHFIDTGFYLLNGEAEETPSPFEVVGAATYDAETDTLAVAHHLCFDCGAHIDQVEEKALSGETAMVWSSPYNGWVCEKTNNEHRPGWYIEITREAQNYLPMEPVVIGPFADNLEADSHMQDSADVEDWVTGEAKSKGYIVDDVFVTATPTVPSYGINAPVVPVYAEGAALGILPGTEA